MSPDGSIAMQNRMFDAADPGIDPLADSARYMSGGAEITLGGDRAAVYSGNSPHENGDLDSGFANPLYAVMQPFAHSDGSQQLQQNGGHPSAPSSSSAAASASGGVGGGDSGGLNGSVA